MNNRLGFVLLAISVMSCVAKTEDKGSKVSLIPLSGTWQLLTGTLIENGDTVVTDYTKDRSFIKIINDSHFAFLHHDLSQGKDSLSVFGAGGGSYSLSDSLYTEHLEYCTAREWEGHDFTFVVQIEDDTLVQSGIEVVESAGVNRLNIEMYKRVK